MRKTIRVRVTATPVSKRSVRVRTSVTNGGSTRTRVKTINLKWEEWILWQYIMVEKLEKREKRLQVIHQVKKRKVMQVQHWLIIKRSAIINNFAKKTETWSYEHVRIEKFILMDFGITITSIYPCYCYKSCWKYFYTSSFYSFSNFIISFGSQFKISQSLSSVNMVIDLLCFKLLIVRGLIPYLWISV